MRGRTIAQMVKNMMTSNEGWRETTDVFDNIMKKKERLARERDARFARMEREANVQANGGVQPRWPTNEVHDPSAEVQDPPAGERDQVNPAPVEETPPGS